MSGSALPRGIVIPLMTPFDREGEVDLPLLKRLTEFHVRAGVQGLFVMGSAGQGPAMTLEQREAALEAIVEVAGGKVFVIDHVGTVDAFSGRRLARHAASCGVGAIAIVPPFYYSDHSEYEVHRHFCEIAEGAPDLPIVIYDNPKYAGIAMPAAATARLRRELPQVSGVKASFSPLEAMLQYVRQLGPDFRVYAGSIEYLAGGVPLGLAGAINPPSSFFPELCVALWHAVEAGRWEEAHRLQRQAADVVAAVGAFSKRFGRTSFAEVMRLRGFPVVRYPRWTAAQMGREDVAELRRALEAAGVGAYLAEAA